MRGTSTADARDRWYLRGLLILIAAASLWATSQRPLFNPDEGRYAEIPREMLVSGDWVVPHLNGVAYIEKPPLQYWATALGYVLLGTSEFSARLVLVFGALGTLGAVWWASRELWTRELARRSTVIAASMLIFVCMGQFLTLDMTLTLFTTASLAAFLVAQRRVEEKRDRAARNCMLVAWGATALGLMTKGLIAALIPFATLILYSLYARDFAPWRGLHLRFGIPLLMLVAIPWHVLAQLRLGDFFQFFFIREHFARFLTPIAERTQPWWFFGFVLVVGAMPWTISALRVLATGWRKAGAGSGFDAPVFLWIWAVFILVFFSLSDSKLIPYVLPAMPAIAICIAASPLKSLRRDLNWTVLVTAVAACALGLAAASLPWLLRHSDRAEYFLRLRGMLIVMAAILAFTCLWAARRRGADITDKVAVLGEGWWLAFILLLCAATVVAPVYSGRSLARALPARDKAAPLYSVGTYDQTLPFYLRRTLVLVAYRGELDYGYARAPQLWIQSVDQFARQWTAQSTAFAILEQDTFDSLKGQAIPMHEIARDAQRILISRSQP